MKADTGIFESITVLQSMFDYFFCKMPFKLLIIASESYMLRTAGRRAIFIMCSAFRFPCYAFFPKNLEINFKYALILKYKNNVYPRHMVL